MTPDGFNCPELLSNVVRTAMIAKHGMPSDRNRHVVLNRAIAKERSFLESIGLSGLLDGDRGFLDWDQWSEFHRSRMNPKKRTD